MASRTLRQQTAGAAALVPHALGCRCCPRPAAGLGRGDVRRPPGTGGHRRDGLPEKGHPLGGCAASVHRHRWNDRECSVGAFLVYAGPREHVLLDRRLYLPQSWAEDAEQREGAGVPEGVTLQAKPQLAHAMLEHLWAQGMPVGWVARDKVYGNDAPLRERIAA